MMTSANAMSIFKAASWRQARWTLVLRNWGVYAAAVIVRLRVLAPYALIELVLPGGSVMALLLWLYRRRKNGVGLGELPVRLPLHSAGPKPTTGRSESVQGAELVAVKVAKIGQVVLTRAAFAHARRFFTRRAAGSQASCMPGKCLLGRCSSKTDRHAIGARRVLAIDGFCDGENAARRSIKDSVSIDSCGRHAKRTEYRIIENLRAL